MQYLLDCWYIAFVIAMMVGIYCVPAARDKRGGTGDGGEHLDADCDGGGDGGD